MNIEPDYLVVGCGATALAFVDTMLRETDATFTIVDRRHAPGGHWNDAYLFVRLHPNISSWLAGCRLDAYGSLTRSLRPDDHERLAMLTKMRSHFMPALQNLTRLAAERA